MVVCFGFLLFMSWCCFLDDDDGEDDDDDDDDFDDNEFPSNARSAR